MLIICCKENYLYFVVISGDTEHKTYQATKWNVKAVYKSYRSLCVRGFIGSVMILVSLPIFFPEDHTYIKLKILQVGSKVETNLQSWGGIQSVSLRELRTHNGKLK